MQLFGLVLAGCGTGVVQPQLQQRTLYPEVSVSFSTADPKLVNHCLGYSERRALHHCSLNMLDLSFYWQSLRESGQFKRVLYQDDDNEYQISITSAFYSEEGVTDVAMSYLSGLTFTLYPISTEHRVETTVAVRWRDHELKRYRYDMPFHRKVRLYYPGNDSEEFVDDVMARFMNDAQRDEVFSPDYLYRSMQASNYERELMGTESLSGFTLASRALSANPYQGLKLDYRTDADIGGQYEVMVYPVPRTDWHDLDATLLDEELRIRHRQADVVLSEVLGSVNYADSIFVQFASETSLPVKGLLFRGEITSPLAPHLWRDTYLFLQKDKFLQVRVTCADQDCLEQGRQFARSIALDVEVPGESPFMAQLRNRHRYIEN